MPPGGSEIDPDDRRPSWGGRLLAATVLVLAAGAAGIAAWLHWAAPPPSPPPLPLASAVIALPPSAAPSPAAVATEPAPPSEPAPPAPEPAAPQTAATVPAPVESPPQAASLPPASAPATPPAPSTKPAPPERPTTDALPPTPDPALVEKGPLGLLPRIGADGRKPWHVYARPFDRADRRPRIAVMVTGLGMSGAATETAINDLAGGVTLDFNPYATRLDEWVDLARAAGHEVFLSLPMEPTDYPREDPGPYTLLTSLGAQQNVSRLQWVLSRVTGYVGVASALGSRFTTSKADLLPVLDAINARGLMFVDSRATERTVAGGLAKSIGLPRAASDVFIDVDASRDAIDARLQRLEALARQNGVAVGMGYVYPVTLERLGQWIPTLERKGFVLAPVSAAADLQADRTAEAGK